LFAVYSDKTHRTDTDLLVDPLAPVIVSALSITITVRWGNTSISSYALERPTNYNALTTNQPEPAMATGIIFLAEFASQLLSRSLMIRNAADHAHYEPPTRVPHFRRFSATLTLISLAGKTFRR
jgi:hypothetical protein